MKKLLHTCIQLFFACTLVSASHAQWSSIPSLSGGQIANDGAAAFSFGTKGYIVAGATANDMYVYDTITNMWTNDGPVPAAMGHAFSMFFSLNGKGYVVGGDTSGVPVSTVFRYDPANTTNPWTQLNDFGGGIRDAGFAFVINDTAYVGSGFDGAAMHSDLWRYDEANDAWVQVTASLPTALIFPASFVIDNKAYVLSGGTTGGVNETNQMWQFNSATQSWIPKASYPGSARQAALAFSNDSYGYFGGGMAGYTTNYYNMFRYNPDSNTWSAAGNMPLFGAAWASVFTIGNNAYAGLGAKFVGSSLNGLDSFYKYSMQVPTGINKVTGTHQVAIYPNPVSDQLHLSIPLNATFEATVYDLVGKIISRGTVQQGTIDVKGLAPGSYILQVKTADEVLYARFIKQ